MKYILRRSRADRSSQAVTPNENNKTKKQIYLTKGNIIMAKIQHIASVKEEFSSTNCKIWFCAHPDDYPLYRESITNDLFGAIDCSVYYDEEPHADYDEQELLSNLHFMNLFVIPVTARLLTEPNRALNVEFKYAMENGIRVLPLIQEPGDLVNTFNEVCGALHCLNAFGKDKENGTYKENLQKYLNKAFAHDFLNKKIFDEFDASIFLSYRKVDREYMLSLIHMIHEAEDCRDIAIWYDDFLTPGENFNTEIKKALDNSDAFVVAITPHILDKNEKGERNYVVAEEYPRAKNANKKILPIRMAPLSKKKLESGFRQHPMPEYVNAQNSGMLSQALKKALSSFHLGKKKETPHHAYLIGLAYLRGLNGELDRSRALSLIERSAESGYIPAIEQLISMYNNGDGVPVDFAKSLEWQRKLVEQRKREYRQKPMQGNLIMLSYSVFDLTKRIFKEEIRDELEKLLSLAEIFYMNHSSACMAKGIAARCCKELAQYHYDQLELGEQEKAEQYLLRALDLYEESIREEKQEIANFKDDTDEDYEDVEEDHVDPDTLHGLVQVYEIMSEKGIRRGSDDCTDYSMKASETLNQLVEITKNHYDPQFLATLQLRATKYQSYREQENTYQSHLDLCRSLVKKTPTVENKRDLITALCNMSNFRQRQSRHGTNEHLPSILQKGRAEIVAKNYGSDYMIASELDLLLDADALISEAFGLCEEVAEITGEASDLRAIANLCDLMGYNKKRLDEASKLDSNYMERFLIATQNSIACYGRAINALEKLVSITDLVSDYDLLAFTLDNRATQYYMIGGKDNHEKCLHDQLKLVDIYKTLHEKTGLVQYLKYADSSYSAISEIYELFGDTENATYFKGKISYDPESDE